MPAEPSAYPAVHAGRLLVRRVLTALGWLGFVLVVGQWLASDFPVQTTSPAVATGMFYLRLGLGLLWPVVFVGQCFAWLRNNQAGGLLAGFSILLALPWLLLLLVSVVAGEYGWQQERILYTARREPAARVVVQYWAPLADIGSEANLRRRVVQLTPLLGAWQRVEPVDTLHFAAKGWQRVSQ